MDVRGYDMAVTDRQVGQSRAGLWMIAVCVVTGALTGTATGGAHPLVAMLAVVGLVGMAVVMLIMAPRHRGVLTELFVLIGFGGLGITLFVNWTTGLQDAYYGFMATLLVTGITLIRGTGVARQ